MIGSIGAEVGDSDYVHSTVREHNIDSCLQHL
jgi:hypothetical protein